MVPGNDTETPSPPSFMRGDAQAKRRAGGSPHHVTVGEGLDPPSLRLHTGNDNSNQVKNVIPNPRSDVGISRGNVGFPTRGDEWHGAVPWPLGLWYRDIVPGDSHVASLLGMTWWVSLRCTTHRGVTPPTRRGRATSPQGEALVVVVPWSHSTTGLPHQSADWFAMTW